MGATQKTGLLYWSLYLDFDEHEKVQYAADLIEEMSSEDKKWKKAMTPMVFTLVLQEIYRRGYYLIWDHVIARKIARKSLMLSVVDVDNYIACFIKARLLSEDKYINYLILTSFSIQKEWKRVAVQAKRKKTNIKEELIIPDDSPTNKCDFFRNNSELMGYTPEILRSLSPDKISYLLSSYSNTNISNNIEKKNKEKEGNSNIPEEMGINSGIMQEEKVVPSGNIPEEMGINSGIMQEGKVVPSGNIPEEMGINSGIMQEGPMTFEKALAGYTKLKGFKMSNDFALRIFFEHKDFERGRMVIWGGMPKGNLSNDQVEVWIKEFGDKFNQWLDVQGIDNRSVKEWGGHFGNWMANQPKVWVEDAPELVWPFESPEFKELWKAWKIYLFTEKDKDYRTVRSEQAALMLLNERSGGVEKDAIEIVKETMGCGWITFQYLKNKNQNGATGSRSGKKEPTGKDVSMSAIFATIDNSIPKDGGSGT